MKSLSFKFKVILVSGLPIILLVALTYYQLSSIKKVELVALDSSKRITTVGFISSVINETQKERGKTAIFLSGGNNYKDVKEQRSLNSKHIKELEQNIISSSLPDREKDEFLNKLSEIKEIRVLVDQEKINLKSSIKRYSSVIIKLLNFISKSAQEIDLAILSKRLISLRILEDAKESGGKLRANMSSILAIDQPLTAEKLTTIITLKAGLVENLRSSGLSIEESSKKLITSFYASDSWRIVNDTFSLILQKSDEGKFNKDPNQFFATITKALKIVNSLVISEKESLLVYSESLRENKSHNFNKYLIFSFVLFALLTVIIILTIISTEKSLKTLKNISSKLEQTINLIKDSSHEVSSISSQLSSLSMQQASGFQQTASSTTEISTIVKRNSESAIRSRELSHESSNSAKRGKSSISRLTNTIDKLSQSNEDIMNAVNKTNNDINAVVKFISEIAEKTNIINDIVFQTKLLSFNASVEAARAGEHGKGFAVVAEEVGNLATMSGDAAVEINQMLEDSIKNANEIVSINQARVDSLIVQGKANIKQCIEEVNECDMTLTQTLENVKTVDKALNDIAISAVEQSKSIEEITVIMQQLDSVNHKNSNLASESATISQQLDQKASQVQLIVKDLVSAIEGE